MNFLFSLLSIFLAISGLQAEQDEFLVISHNVGKGQGDFNNVVSYLQNKALLNADESIDQKSRERTGFGTILSMKPDVVLLQELGKKYTQVGYENRPIFDLLDKAPQYQLIWLENKNSPDCAVLINTDRFELVDNLSFNLMWPSNSGNEFHRDVAIAHVKDLRNQKELVFVSAYVPGFNVIAPEEDRVLQGDQYMQAILNLLITKKLTHLNTIMGGDMNANDTFLPTYSTRIADLQQANVKVFWTNQDTNVNMTEGQGDHQTRKLDFISYLPAKKSKISQGLSWIGLGRRLPSLGHSEVSLLDGFLFVSPLLYSDHLPITQTYSWQ